jgi:type II secretory pathway pseudopilin PulG
MLAMKFNKGFTYIGLLLFIAITGIGLSVAGMSWQYQVRSEKEKDLLFVGVEFTSALNSYYYSSPDVTKVYPASLNDLLLDKRMPNIKRHLRKIYLDPMTGKADWSFVRQQGRIVGIYSSSSLVPYKKKIFNLADKNFNGTKSYKEWVFKNNENGTQKNISSFNNLPSLNSSSNDQTNSNSNSNVAEVSESLNTLEAPTASVDEGKSNEVLSPWEQKAYKRYYR